MKQLIQNQYYLHHLPQTIKSYTFIASTKDCFTLDSNSNLIITPFKEVTSALVSIHQESLVLDEIESLFPPEKFLVSPFNSPHQFKEGHYFLTNPQRKIKADILRFVEDSNRGCFCALTGGPGTGKSLLLYDIAHTLKREGKRIMIGHCGALNAGHGELIKNGWPIKLTMDLVSKRNDKWTIVDDEVDVFLIDEAQRCYDYVMDSLVEWLVQVGKKCVFSYDADQVMSIDEQRRMNSTRIEELAKDNKFCLSSNIRTNASVYGFVRALFNKRHAANGFARDHIRISFCRTIEQAKDMLNTLKEYGYCVPKFTPMMHYIEEYESWFPGDSLSAHGVIGQEFDVVVGLLSENLYYDDDDQLASHGRYHYLEVRMLYQILTRARDKIHLVIVNNATILERCMKLLKG